MIIQTLTTSFKTELLQGIHNFNTDVFKIALYETTANLSASTTVYTSTGELAPAPAYTFDNVWVPYYDNDPTYANRLYYSPTTAQPGLVGKYAVGAYIPTGTLVTAVGYDGSESYYYATINQNITDISVFRQETVNFYSSLSSQGYTPGGNTLTVNPTPTSGSSGGTTAYVSFNNTSWSPASFTAAGALIYNSSKSNKAVAVLNFGDNKTASGTFTITFPAANANNAIIRIA